MKLKSIFLLSAFLFNVALQAQTNTFPSNGNAGIGTLNPDFPLQIVGAHNTTRLGLFYPHPNPAQQANLTLWASEPGWTWSGVGIGNNAYVTSGVTRINTSRGGSYLRLLDQAVDMKLIDINGVHKSVFSVSSNGFVGFGIQNPESRFSLLDNATGVSMSGGGNPYFGTLAFNRETQTGTIMDAAGKAFQINNGGPDQHLHIQVYNGTGTMVTGNALVISGDNGNVGIGTSNPREALSVNGKIRAQEVKVETANWPDYVFAKDYQLTGLGELEEYIKMHQHLPDVPSAANVEKEGVALGEMNKILLKKLEELTLYLIEKDKEIKALQLQISKK